MERVKKARATERMGVTKLITQLEAELKLDPIPRTKIVTCLQLLNSRLEKLRELDEAVMGMLLDDEATESNVIEAEDHAAHEYLMKATLVKNMADALLHPETAGSAHGDETSTASSSLKRRFKLPKIEMRKFNGELTEWLGWWAQFQKIDEDEELDDSDKFSYLLLGVVKGSRAHEVVRRYPESRENYKKAVAALKERFGKKKILRQVYVRKLIQLILDNKSREKAPLSTLYDQLEASLRSLESLDVERENMVEFLFPMVESSLPEDVLLAWQRSTNFGRDGSTEEPPKSELDYLMDFLQTEVENEEQRKLVKSGFGLGSDKKKTHQKYSDSQEEDLPTAAGLHNGTGEIRKKPTCIFCEKGHPSADCFKARKMTLEERQSLVKEKRACYSCLTPGHLSRKCKVKCAACGGKHAVMMCPEIVPKDKGAGEEKTLSNVTMSKLNCTRQVLLRTLMVDLENPVTKEKRRVRVLLDCGSQKSYVLVKTAEDLGLKSVGKETLKHELFGGTVVEQEHDLYELRIGATGGKFSFRPTLYDEPRICGIVPRASRGPWMAELKEKGIWVNDVNPDMPMEVEVLIGSDILGRLLTGRIHQLKNGLTATETKFGWTLMGPMEAVKTLGNLAMSVLSMAVSSSSVTDLWNLETLGIRDPVETKSQELREREAQEHFVKTVEQKADGMYSVSLPWINGSQPLPSNRAVAQKRLEAATKKLISVGKFKEYDAVFRDWESEGIISEVKDAGIEEAGCHYLPHRPVFKASLTTPVRPVFDASCKVGRNPSLNECLEKGPNMLELIPSVLMRFRMGNIGVTADIRKAFLMIEVNEEDRDFLRFLWWEDGSQKQVRVFQHNRVVFGMNCSPFLLGAVISFHIRNLGESQQDVGKLVQDSLYVDNLVMAVDTAEDFESLKGVATGIMSKAGMELRQWERSGLVAEDPVTGVLGLKWDKVKDVLFCDTLPMEIPAKITKRAILSQIQRVFDPLGFLSPVLIVPKILLQQAWIDNKKWDEEVSPDMQKEFEKWWTELSSVIDDIRIPRNCSGGMKTEEGKFQLHVFCDASKKAYAAAVFLRVETETGVHVQLLQAKARVTPLKKSTIPRLELLSCGIAARLANSVKTALSLEKVPIQYWTDSTTALSWIRSSDQWGTFVGNRVKEIVQSTSVADWRHVPGHLNPADLPSRGISPSKFVKLRWWEGPDWLKLEKEKWPREEFQVNLEEVNQERKNVISTLTVTASQRPWYIRSASYYWNLRVIGYVFRFLDQARKRRAEKRKQLSREEIRQTELKLFLMVQTEAFSPKDGVVKGLRVEKDKDGIIRVKTKLTHRQDREGFRKPVLLPNSHPLVDLLVMEEHALNSHGGLQFLMSRIREKAWIVHGRNAIGKVLRKCVTCRRFDSRKPEVPVCALPEDRVKDAKAFEITGVDLAGPLTLKNGEKVYVVLYTCAVYRCVHLELLQSLSTEDFLLSFVRFSKRKRRPSIVYSDNGSNFHGAVNLFKMIDWGAVERRTQKYQVEWKFNPPSGPWWGGWWERLIRSAKDLLRKMLGFRKLSYVELETCLCEVEEVMNHRPLTFVTEGLDDLIPLTPAMFIADLPFEDIPEAKLLSVDSLGRRKKKLDTLLQEIQTRFRAEYLGQLVQRGKDKKVREFKVGEVVLVEVDNKKRILWPMARIMELMPGKDGVIRVARIKTKNGSLLLRPIQRLFPLEVESEIAPRTSIKKIPEGNPNWEEAEPNRVVARTTVTKRGRDVRKPERYCDY